MERRDRQDCEVQWSRSTEAVFLYFGDDARKDKEWVVKDTWHGQREGNTLVWGLHYLDLAEGEKDMAECVE